MKINTWLLLEAYEFLIFRLKQRKNYWNKIDIEKAEKSYQTALKQFRASKTIIDYELVYEIIEIDIATIMALTTKIF